MPDEHSGSRPESTVPPGTFEFRVNVETKKEAGLLIGDLQAFLQQRTEDIRFERRREDPSAQDAGTLLVAVLVPVAVELAKVAGPALQELAKGVADWMRRRSVSVVVNGVTLEGSPEQVEGILRKLANNP